ncbi:hypothetical protein RRG08_007974 [Elysia crispata]|uniref:Uncharacterized protein n=1 Tax=Elysia crispata TaxID=231223 RepID=A0AAE0ZRX1_9GAST|nr:hypothetical protein RRG08_007974 [Elysia crispata]
MLFRLQMRRILYGLDLCWTMAAIIVAFLTGRTTINGCGRSRFKTSQADIQIGRLVPLQLAPTSPFGESVVLSLNRRWQF